jgi:hypothetical protein
MAHPLTTVAPEFMAMAHRIVWCVAATVDTQGRPRSRVLHPIWEWDGTELAGWVATSPLSPKAADLRGTPAVSLTYWAPSQDTCTADCRAVWEISDEQRRAGWERFAQGPSPVGYLPSIVPGWTSPDAPAFGILRLVPDRLRVMPGTLMLKREGELLTWRRTAPPAPR